MASELSGVLLDFAGTLFDQETETSTLRAIGVPERDWPELLAAIARADDLARTPALLPNELARQWERRDLTQGDHRPAFVGVLRHGGLPAEIAEAFYDRACSAQAWLPFDDTAAFLRALHARRIPVAVVSNIGWDLRPIFERHDMLALIDAFVLSYEHGIMKPDPGLFCAACLAIGVAPEETVMIGDSAESDGGATAIGCRFAQVRLPHARDALSSALERAAAEFGRGRW